MTDTEAKLKELLDYVETGHNGHKVRCVKVRRHHNNKGLRQTKRNKTWRYIRALAKRLKVRFAP